MISLPLPAGALCARQQHTGAARAGGRRTGAAVPSAVPVRFPRREARRQLPRPARPARCGRGHTALSWLPSTDAQLGYARGSVQSRSGVQIQFSRSMCIQTVRVNRRQRRPPLVSAAGDTAPSPRPRPPTYSRIAHAASAACSTCRPRRCGRCGWSHPALLAGWPRS